jgi:hypothetical protein
MRLPSKLLKSALETAKQQHVEFFGFSTDSTVSVLPDMAVTVHSLVDRMIKEQGPNSFRIGGIMMLFRACLTLMLAILLSSCSGKHAGLTPYLSNNWQPNESSAVILVGSESPEQIWSVTPEGYNFSDVSIGWAGGKQHDFEVFAISQNENGSFKLKEIKYLVGGGPTGVTFRVFKFENLPEIEISSQGIYYYGTFYIRNGRAIFQKIPDERAIKATNRAYPALIDKMEIRF